jgi:phosphatidylglycerophosphate synthase
MGRRVAKLRPAAMRWHVPGRGLQTSVLLAGAVACAAVIGAAVVAQAWLPLGAAYPARALVVFATAFAAVCVLIGHHHPHQRFGAANQVTLARAVLTALLAALVAEPADAAIAAAAVGAAVAVTVLDGVDGFLARRNRMVSRFGARFDVETDALFVMVLSVLVWQYGKAGAWVLIGGLLRYAFVAAGWILPWLAGPLRPTRRARVIAVCHMAGLIVALAPLVPVPLSTAAAGASLALLSWSFAVDIRRLWHGDHA